MCGLPVGGGRQAADHDAVQPSLQQGESAALSCGLPAVLRRTDLSTSMFSDRTFRACTPAKGHLKRSEYYRRRSSASGERLPDAPQVKWLACGSGPAEVLPVAGQLTKRQEYSFALGTDTSPESTGERRFGLPLLVAGHGRLVLLKPRSSPLAVSGASGSSYV